MDWLPDYLRPSRLAGRRRSRWCLGSSRTLPKNSDPAGAHRPLCDRSGTPTAELDSILCRAGVFVLRTFDCSEHLDIDDPKCVVDCFQELSADYHTSVRVVDADYDMKGCFTHVPQVETVQAVRYVCDDAVARGYAVIHVPKKRASSASPVWNGSRRDGLLPVDVALLPRYAAHHCAFCFAWFGKVLQRQIKGHPMGSAFSVFLQRCWAMFRELYFSRSLDVSALRTPGCRVAFVFFLGIRLRLLEVRCADEVSQTAILPSDADLPDHLVQFFLRERLETLYHKRDGRGVTLVPGERGVFTGLVKNTGVPVFS